jgi:hypothetical protein
MVPKKLTTEQKANRRDMSLDLLDRLERDPEFFIRVEEKRIEHCNTLNKSFCL